jgi:hypothetical protein
MPTVQRFSGLRVVVYPNDHPPPHVHVIGRGCEALFELHCPSGPVSLRENYGFPVRDVPEMRRWLSERVPLLCGEWRRYHGNG